MTRPVRIAAVIAAALLTAVTSFAKNGAFQSTAHGDRINGPQRRLDRQRGSCSQCHESHLSHEAGGTNDGASLFTPNSEDFCFVCHTMPSENGVFPGPGDWTNTAHARAANMERPGATPSTRGINKCVACHDPHGVKDSDGVVPSMLAMRESTLCFSCHDGSRSSDVKADFEKTWRHPVGSIGKHHAGENTPDAFAAFPANNRHVECSDCHDVHRVETSAAPPIAPEASARLAGVSRVQVSNGGAAVVPNYVWRNAGDPSPVNEFEVCFKCHSSFAPQKPGQANLALLTNPSNPSFHPIQAQGKNPRIDPGAFANGVDAQSIILCTDCHASDDPVRKGPHGSSYRYILRKPSTTTNDRHAMTSDDICFQCHAWRVYGDSSSTAADQALSRFNAPAGSGHVFHVAVQQIPCYSCHETHGSTQRPALIATRFPGITSYTQTPLGGTCVTACHAPQSYSINYPR